MFHSSSRSLSLFAVLSLCALVQAEDQLGSYKLEEPSLLNLEYPTGLIEEDLRNLPLTAPKLRIAYVFLIRAAMGGPKIVDDRTPEMVASLNDLKRRGDTATPLMLDIMEKNHNTSLERLIPLVIDRVGTIQMAPYVDYLRQMVKDRPDEISAAANEAALTIFLEHGTQEDVKMVQDLAKKRPFLAPSVERAFEFQRWKSPAPSRPAAPTITPASSPVVLPQASKLTPVTKTISSSTPSQEPTSSTSWSVVAVLIIAVIGLLWLVLKNRK